MIDIWYYKHRFSIQDQSINIIFHNLQTVQIDIIKDYQFTNQMQGPQHQITSKEDNNETNHKQQIQSHNEKENSKQQKHITINGLVLRQNIPSDLLQLIKDQFDQTLLICKKWQSHRMPQICPYVLQYQNKGTFSLYGNKYPKIYMQIKDIGFPYLKYMNTWANNIESIECLSNIFWPNLERICLWKNKIVSIRPLTKINAPRLNWIDLKQNFILDQTTLSELYNPSKLIRRLHIQCFSDARALLKMQFQSAYDLIPSSPQALKSSELKQIFNLKRYRKQNPTVLQDEEKQPINFFKA